MVNLTSLSRFLLLLVVIFAELLIGGFVNYLLACSTHPLYCSALWWDGFSRGISGFGLSFAVFTLIALGIRYLVLRHRNGKEVSSSA